MSRPGSRSKLSGRALKVALRKGKERSVSQKQWLERQLNDPYVREAKKQGYRARSAFKLIQIDEKYRLFRKGQIIVDLGAAPGSWSQVAADRVKAAEGLGRVIAIDQHGMDPLPGVVIFQADFLSDEAPAQLLAALKDDKVDVVLSDMAAHATGHRQTDHLKIMALVEAGLDFASEVLAEGGTYLAKVLRGGSEAAVLARMKQEFTKVRHVKPMASREDSAELFVLATGFRKNIGKESNDEQ